MFWKHKLNTNFQPLLISSPVAMRPETETHDKMLQTRPKTTPKVNWMLRRVAMMPWWSWICLIRMASDILRSGYLGHIWRILFRIFWVPWFLGDGCVWASLGWALRSGYLGHIWGIFFRIFWRIFFKIFWASWFLGDGCVWASLGWAAAPCGRNEAPGVEPAH